ncbi:hypothetical protein B7494_g6476 [Chlorociboria aeruginascens]|nr:hypothetical protein B7494_g6476 [Chlorociboria aeruginascens]
MASTSFNIIRNGGELPVIAIEELRSLVKCEVLIKGEAKEEAYVAAIDRFNKACIQEAAIIVFCESEVDIASVLLYVQKWNIEFTISSGGHSYYGASSTHGLVIAEGYSVVMGAVNDTGIAGLTLGGGTGMLTGQYGLVIDNLLAARVVLADGRVLEASAEKNPDLFWAIKGGGSNFGVVSEFTYRIHKQNGDVYFGILIYAPDKVDQFLELAKTFYKIVDASAGKLAIFAFFTRKLPGVLKAQPMCLIFYDGPEEEAKRLLASAYDLGPIAQMGGMKKLAECTETNEQVLGPPTHQRYTTSNAQLPIDLDTDVLRTLIQDMDTIFDKYGPAVAPSKVGIEFRSYNKSTSIPIEGTALASRRPAILALAEVQYDASISDSTMRAEVKSMVDKVRESIKSKREGPKDGAYFNANIGSGTEKSNEMFGENLPRLRDLKRKYDPDFIFRRWYPIEPATV